MCGVEMRSPSGAGMSMRVEDMLLTIAWWDPESDRADVEVFCLPDSETAHLLMRIIQRQLEGGFMTVTG